MRVDNQTSDPVDWEQTGGGTGDPTEEEFLASQEGSLAADGETGTFAPVGKPPYQVSFTATDGTLLGTSCKFSDPDAVVTLNPGGKVDVSTGCD